MNKKIGLITGASSGIGAATAKKLAANGAIVIINYRSNPEKAEKIVQEIKNNGAEAIKIQADVSDKEQVKKMMNEIKEKFGRLDFLVNNAGIHLMKSLEQTSLQEREKILKVNLTGYFLVLKYAIPLLKNSKNPKVVNIASRLGTKPKIGAGAYCCSKAGVVMLTKVATLELAKYGIIVNTVSPGLTDTPLARNAYKDPKIWENTLKNTPVGKIAKPENIANVINFLISDECTHIDGENIDVSGGNLLC